jgi:hypothetical protein
LHSLGIFFQMARIDFNSALMLVSIFGDLAY